MKRSLLVCAACWVIVFGLSPARAQLATAEKARVVARNWIETIIEIKGGWGDSETAQITEVTEFKRGDRVLGYYCPVEPSGHIIVSLLEGLAPVKAFSESSTLDPNSDEGPADLLKLKMESILDEIERQIGPLPTVREADLDRVLALNHRTVWQQLEAGTLPVQQKFKPRGTTVDYQEGQILLTSRWHQGSPYNLQCPASPPEYGCPNDHCKVGCVATAGAQIMRYWSWPPGRDWVNMPDEMLIDPTGGEINAVAELCWAIGDAVGMDWCTDGGCGSAVPTCDMENVYQGWAYDANCAVAWRYEWDWDEWYQIIKDNLNQNRPIQYRIKKHSIVCDGWWQLPSPMYHMNYGWANDYDDWYVVDNLYQVGGGTPADEYIVHNIYPHGSLGPSISGTFPANPDYPHRYVDRDCSASSVHFHAGQLIHFLPRLALTCTSGYCRFDGTPTHHTRLYTADYGRGILIEDGSIVMHQDGGIKFRLQRLD